MKRRCKKAEYFWHIFFPNRCLFCERPIAADEVFCPQCEKEQPLLPPTCNACGNLIGQCVCSVPVFSVFRYEEGVKRAIRAMKFTGDRVVAQKLAQLMADRLVALSEGTLSFDCVVPVPMHKKDRKERGFSQSEWLAEALSEQISAVCLNDAIQKTRWTKKQHTLTAQERKRNLIDAFAVNQPEQIVGKSVLLVDDVYTTGTTVMENAHVLLNAGARAVTVCTAAKTTFTEVELL